MRILLHDYGCFPYPWQLARCLAERGYTVNYVFNAAEPARNTLDIPEGLTGRLTATPVSVPRPLLKRSFVKRRAWEVEFGRLVEPVISDFEPDVVISGNSPLDVQSAVQRSARRHDAKFIFWVQDLVSVATYEILKNVIPVAGSLIGKYYMRLEQSLLRASDEVVLITEDFGPFMDRWGVDRERTHVIENWAPLQDLPQHPRDNEWAREHDTVGKLCLLYAGTLGLKHNPELLAKLAMKLKADAGVKIIIAGDGSGIPMLRKMKEQEGLDNLEILPFQPFNVLPKVLASADLLMAILEPEGSLYCVPSKVLTYLCSGRPILLAVSEDNLSARIVRKNGAGSVVPPRDVEEFIAAAEAFLGDPALRARCGASARRYAECNFDIESIADRFERLLVRRTSAVVERHEVDRRGGLQTVARTGTD